MQTRLWLWNSGIYTCISSLSVHLSEKELGFLTSRLTWFVLFSFVTWVLLCMSCLPFSLFFIKHTVSWQSVLVLCSAISPSCILHSFFQYATPIPTSPNNDFNINTTLPQLLIDKKISPKFHKYWKCKQSKSRAFHLLIKVHKPNNPGRLIISGINTLRERISEFVDYTVNHVPPLLPSFVQDTNQSFQNNSWFKCHWFLATNTTPPRWMWLDSTQTFHAMRPLGGS